MCSPRGSFSAESFWRSMGTSSRQFYRRISGRRFWDELVILYTICFSKDLAHPTTSGDGRRSDSGFNLRRVGHFDPRSGRVSLRKGRTVGRACLQFVNLLTFFRTKGPRQGHIRLDWARNHWGCQESPDVYLVDSRPVTPEVASSSLVAPATTSN